MSKFDMYIQRNIIKQLIWEKGMDKKKRSLTFYKEKDRFIVEEIDEFNDKSQLSSSNFKRLTKTLASVDDIFEEAKLLEKEDGWVLVQEVNNKNEEIKNGE